MSQESIFLSRDAFLAQYSELIETLCVRADCARWELLREVFSEALWRSTAKRFHVQASSKTIPHSDVSAVEIESYLSSLHVEDLALACACSQGIETAWEFFIASSRQDLRNASRAILRASGCADGSRAEELADSVYADLYGIRVTPDGHRKSLFEYFHGRSKLSTWLRAVLAQRHVDLLRGGAKTISLDEKPEGEAARELPRTDGLADPDRERYLKRFDVALTGALANRTPRERMLLACYYLDQLTLAEIGRLLREHESTVSRHLDSTRRALREDVTQRLLLGLPAQDGCGAKPGLSEAQVELAFEYALGEWPFDLSRALSTQATHVNPPER